MILNIFIVICPSNLIPRLLHVLFAGHNLYNVLAINMLNLNHFTISVLSQPIPFLTLNVTNLAPNAPIYLFIYVVWTVFLALNFQILAHLWQIDILFLKKLHTSSIEENIEQASFSPAQFQHVLTLGLGGPRNDLFITECRPSFTADCPGMMHWEKYW